MSDKTVYVVDGHAQMYRAYHTPFDGLEGPNGEPTSATFIFTRMFFAHLELLKPKYILFTADSQRTGLAKRKFYPGYKTEKHEVQRDFYIQEVQMYNLLEAMDIQVLRHPAWEADDIIASIVNTNEEYKFKTVILGRDKDLHQLVSKDTMLFDPVKQEYITYDNMLELKGYSPEMALAIQTLTGDATDTIPGCRGIGPKTAAKLLRKHGTPEQVLTDEVIAQQTPRLQESMREFKTLFPITKQLVTLNRHIPLQFTYQPLVIDDAWRKRVATFLETLGFESLLGWVYATELRR